MILIDTRSCSTQQAQCIKNIIHYRIILARANRYKKWKNILGPIWKEFQWKGVVEDPDTTIEEGEGIKMYLRKDGKCYDLKKTTNGAMQISPRPKLTGVYADGLYLRRPGSGIFGGEGLILGRNSPFKNIPILGWIL